MIYAHASIGHEAPYPPSRPAVVPRPRLIEQLAGGMHCKLSLISAPAGFGKTNWSAIGLPAAGERLPGCRWMKVIATRLLRTELSGPDIARELLVSLNTLRTHTKNIFSKLGVNNRRAAVCRAGELGLF